MKALPFEIQQQFFRALAGETSIQELEKWIYSETKLEEYLGEEAYIDLISLGFKDKHALHEVEQVVSPFLDYGKYETYKLSQILLDIVHITENFPESLVKTYDLYCQGYSFLDGIGLGHGLHFDYEYYYGGRWLEMSGNQRSRIIAKIHPEAKKEALEVLKWLESGDIELTGKTDDQRHYQYIDHRAEQHDDHGVESHQTEKPEAKESLSYFSKRPEQLFVIDGLGALLSAFLLGVVLVHYQPLFGIPKNTLYFLATLPCLFAIFDLSAYLGSKKLHPIRLKWIGAINLAYCLVSLGLATYHFEQITFLGFAHIALEVIIVSALGSIEIKTSKMVALKSLPT